MELSSMFNVESFGDLGTPVIPNSSANDLFEGFNWDSNTIPEVDSDISMNLNSSIDEWVNPFHQFDDIQEVMSPASSAGADSSCVGIETEFDPDKTQNLIDEVEEFLDQHENGMSVPIKTENIPLNTSLATSFFNDSGIQDMDLKTTESILDALVTGNVINTAASSPSPSHLSNEDDDMFQTIAETVKIPSSTIQQPPIENQQSGKTIDLTEIMASGAANIVDCSKLTNVSEFVLEDGRNVIIMIAAPSKSQSTINSSELSEILNNEARSGHMGSNPVSPQASSSVSSGNLSDSSDSEWLPFDKKQVKSEKKRGSPRTAVPPPSALIKKGSGINKRVKSTIIDKKERKKWQNVEAARRYRDKKKQEQSECEIEIKTLEDKNFALKETVGQMENELSTLKKLMAEIGLIKI